MVNVLFNGGGGSRGSTAANWNGKKNSLSAEPSWANPWGLAGGKHLLVRCHFHLQKVLPKQYKKYLCGASH